MKCLVLGGAGYLGCMLSKKLLENNHKVTIIDNLYYDQGYLVSDILLHKNCQFYKNDIMDSETLSQFKKNDVIYNLAAMVGPICDSVPDEARRVNLEAVHQHKTHISKSQRYAFMCSSSGYGIANKTCTELDEMKSISLYAQTKEEAEKVVMNEIPNASSFRLATVYGRSLYHRMDLLVNDLTWQAVKKKKLSLYQGNFKRTYIEITNVIEMLSSWKTDPRMNGQIYNAASDNFTKSELVDKIKQFIPDLKVEYSSQEDFDKRCYFLDCSKIHKLGYKFDKNLDNSLQELINFYKIIPDNQDNLNRLKNNNRIFSGSNLDISPKIINESIKLK